MTETDPIELTEIQLEVINRCNFQCPLCKSLQKDWVPRRSMQLDEVRSVIDPIARDISNITLYGTRGEPLLHKEIDSIVDFLTRVTTAKVSISTNASLLTEDKGKRLLDAGLDQLVVAVDGITEASYSAYRHGGNLEQILKNIRRFCELKAAGQYNMRVIFQFIPMAGNEHELSKIPPLAYELGVDLVKAKFSSSVARSDQFKTRSKIFQDLVPEEEHFACPFGIHKVYVDPNGFAYPCCYAEGEKDLCMGNAVTDVRGVWESDAMQQYKRAFVNQENFPQFCMDKCYRAPRKKKLLIRKNELKNQQWLEVIKTAMQ